MTQPCTAADLAGPVAAALGSADLDAFAKLLAPDVQWGPVGDFVSGCHNRREVLAWYRAARDRGMRARVTEVVAGADKLLVGLQVSGTEAADDAGGSAERWQVLIVRDGQVCDIRGYDDRAEAATRVGVS